MCIPSGSDNALFDTINLKPDDGADVVAFDRAKLASVHGSACVAEALADGTGNATGSCAGSAPPHAQSAMNMRARALMDTSSCIARS